MAMAISPTEKQKQSEFAKLFQKQEAKASIHSGQLVKGRIVQITKDTVMIDIGYKSEGRIATNEFKDAEGNLTVEPGEEVEVLVENIEDEEGRISLSKERADSFKAWDHLAKIQEEGGLVEGIIKGKIKGGLSVDVGVNAFLPGSQIDVRPVRNLDRYIGKSYRFKILKLNKRRGNVVLSRREAMEREPSREQESVLQGLKEGQLIDGSVKNITDYGVFVDLGGFDGLLHVTDMSWGRVGHPSDMFKVGDTVKVMILRIDPENRRVSLGYKQLQKDPWQGIEGEFPVGSRIKGKVVGLADYGAFVELKPGVEGLVHISEISWNKKLRHPSSELNAGDAVEAIVLDCDVNARRIALGVKQLKPNPWDTLEQGCPVGSKVKGEVRNITDFGLFIDCGVGLDGLIHLSDIDWVQNFARPDEVCQRGEKVEAVVLQIDRDQERFSLSLKQLKENPWETIRSKYGPGTKAKGKVEALNSAGAVIRLTKELCGLLPKPAQESTQELKIGDKVEVEVAEAVEGSRKFHFKLKS
ncbi:MAG: 30S ribosomal protein S1 [Deltaproteobacteria bacterium]|nr:30S ribosomal protein S1 [Deltaproteobacteria bacterium]